MSLENSSQINNYLKWFEDESRLPQAENFSICLVSKTKLAYRRWKFSRNHVSRGRNFLKYHICMRQKNDVVSPPPLCSALCVVPAQGSTGHCPVRLWKNWTFVPLIICICASPAGPFSLFSHRSLFDSHIIPDEAIFWGEGGEIISERKI